MAKRNVEMMKQVDDASTQTRDDDKTEWTSGWPGSIGDFCFQNVPSPSAAVRAANRSVTARRQAVMSMEQLRKRGRGLVADTGRNPRNSVIA